MLTKSLQDYIEFIFIMLEQEKVLKSVDISKHFNISRSSASEALIKLCEKGLILYEGRKGITITDEGKNEARKVIKNHLILKKFFIEILCADNELANENACRIEHVVDDKLISMIDEFTSYCISKNIKFTEKKHD